jgi:hypothetical protein
MSRDHADIVRAGIRIHPDEPTDVMVDLELRALAALDALVAERDEWEVAAKKISGARNRWKKRAEAAGAERDELRRNGLTDLTETARKLEAAEDEVARLREALEALESATRILDVMLREPAAKGLMTAEDYRGYVNGAWLGVDGANVKARAALGEEA